ncbi:hypothetical protein [Halobaculum marinum]|uniref:Uncharacterized protein n=1 Tax=Halobaculum marinum TaxID=3031996 RepID=A0ABD5WTT0_9EURY|nr:hypothetical protein [Halobaculum sp. DT55]
MAAVDVNLVTGLLGSSADLTYLAVGAAGGLNLLELFGIDVLGGDV